MNNLNTYALAMIGVFAIVTIIIRFFPFLVFKKNTPKPLIYLGRVLPFSIMGMLVVYCLRGVDIFSGSRGIPELIACGIVFLLHKMKHNTLLSILGGTISYMLIINLF